MSHTSQKLSSSLSPLFLNHQYFLSSSSCPIFCYLAKIQNELLSSSSMADDETSPSPKPQIPLAEASSNHENHPTNKSYSHFLYKAAFATVFLVLLPLFPCEIINQSESSTSWELLQLIFVGIAVSYGLFSKKNDEVEKDQGSKHDNAQSYVSKLLQVSSVFDDESENQTTVIDENRVQTRNSQYYREEPVVVVAKENPNVKEDMGVTLGIGQKPLLLPVRSLKQRAPEPSETDLVNDSSGKDSISRSNSNSSSNRFSTNLSIPKNREMGGKFSENLEEKTEDIVVLSSPIPWRSRSGRIETEGNGENPEFRLETRSFKRNPSPKSLSPSQSLSSPNKLLNSASVSLESQPKINEDVVRKKKFSSPPPPPPPPPFPQKYLKKSNSSSWSTSFSSEKEFKRSVRSTPIENLSNSETDELPRRTSPGSELRGRIVNDGVAKSVRTFMSSEPLVEAENKSNNYDVKFSKEEHKDFFEKVLVETTDDDSDNESEDDNFVGSLGNGEEAVNVENGNDPAPDVDKKADEFIAKFRNQIRLQRINSFRRSTADRTLKN